MPELDLEPFDLDVAGFPTRLELPLEQLERVHLPLLRDLAATSPADGRLLVLLAGPVGTGKSTLAALWQQLAARLGLELQALPMDGFHLANAVLDARTTVLEGRTVPLRQVKGSPESFDLAALQAALAAVHRGDNLCWPRYDRRIHDPVPDALPVLERGILLVEGNYLLLDEPGWRELRPLADLGIFIEGREAWLRDDVIARYRRGGRSPESARAQYLGSDRRNFERVMRNRLPADIVLTLARDRRLSRGSDP